MHENKITTNLEIPEETFSFGMYSDGKEGGSDGKEGGSDGRENCYISSDIPTEIEYLF